jgi:hypothetical protein
MAENITTEENITTLLDKPDAENVSGSDYLYLVQGTGSDRDRKISLAALFASSPAHTLLVDDEDLIPKRYLLPSFAKSNEVTRLTPEGGQVYFISKEVTRDGGTARAISGVIANKAITSDLIGDKAVVRDKIGDDAAGAAQLDETETYNMAGLTITGAKNSVTMTEQSPSDVSQGIVVANGVIDHGYQLLRATTATYDLTSAHGSGDNSYLTHIVALYNSYSGQCTVTIDSPTGGEAPKTVLLNSGNVGLFMKIGGNGTTPVFAPVSFSRTVNS